MEGRRGHCADEEVTNKEKRSETEASRFGRQRARARQRERFTPPFCGILTCGLVHRDEALLKARDG